MRSCPECIYYDRCDYIFDGCLSNRDNKACDWFDDKNNYLKLPCRVGDVIYFTGYGIVEELNVYKASIEYNEAFIDNYIGYVEARRPDGTTESIGFNVFGELAFANKEDAKNALNKQEAADEY
jgi:hypothetical protein